MNHDYYYVASTGILGLRATERSFRWSFGATMPQATAQEYDACQVRIRLTVGEREAASGGALGETALGKYHYFSGSPGADKIYYRRRFIAGSWMELAAAGLLTDQPHFTVNPTYYRFAPYRFINLHAASAILTDVAALLLLRRGYAALHCSAFRLGNATVVVFAPANSGKTLTTLMACLERGASFLAEDIAITDGRLIHSVPWTSTFRYYSSIDRRWGSQIASKLVNVVPPLELLLLPFRKLQPIDAHIPCNRILDSSPITHLVILERGDTLMQEETQDECLRKILNLNRYEFYYSKSPLALAYEYFNPDLNLDGARATERALLARLIQQAAGRYFIRTNDPRDYLPMILGAIG